MSKLIVSILVFLDLNFIKAGDYLKIYYVSILVFLDLNSGLWGLKFALRGKFSYLNVGDRG